MRPGHRSQVTPQEWARGQPLCSWPGGPQLLAIPIRVPGPNGGSQAPTNSPYPMCAPDMGQGRQLTPKRGTGREAHLDVALPCGGGSRGGVRMGLDAPGQRELGEGPHGVLHPTHSSWEAWGGKRARAHPPPAQVRTICVLWQWPWGGRISPWPRRPPPGSWLWGRVSGPGVSPSPRAQRPPGAPLGASPGRRYLPVC